MNRDEPPDPLEHNRGILPRPEGMSRQQHRRLFRQAKKAARGDWQQANQLAAYRAHLVEQSIARVQAESQTPPPEGELDHDKTEKK